MFKPSVEIRLLDPGELLVALRRLTGETGTSWRSRDKWHLYAAGSFDGRYVAVTRYAATIKPMDGDVYLGQVTHHRKQNVFVLRGWQVAGMLDEFIDVFQQLGHRCVYETPEGTDAKT